MTRISIYSVKLVKEDSGNYDVKKSITNPEVAADIINKVLDLENRANEVFAIICLNAKNFIVGVHEISIGSLSSSIVHPREVFKAAILNNAGGIILFHNHPTGDPEPSHEDIETTIRLVEAGDMMGIKVIDHIIIGENRYVSFKEKGLI